MQDVQTQLVANNKLTLPETRMGADGKERPTTYTKPDPDPEPEAAQQQPGGQEAAQGLHADRAGGHRAGARTQRAGGGEGEATGQRWREPRF